LPCGGVYEGRDRELDAYQGEDEKDGGRVEPVHEQAPIDFLLSDAVQLALDTKRSTDKFVSECRAMSVSKKEISRCPIDATLSVIDGRWKGTILWRLLDEPMRTNELQKSIPEITERMLLRHLRELTSAGILERHQELGFPLRVRYSLTPYGMTLVPVLDVLCTWGRERLRHERSA
jgi:DNA-binding HxlR family transcriptional regulator